MMEKLIEHLEGFKHDSESAATNAMREQLRVENWAINRCIEAVKNFSPWTKVEDGLPEIGMMGRMSDLICFEVEDEKIVTGRLYIEDGYTKLIFAYTNLNDYEVSEVKKWMPIPKSKEDGK